MQDRTRDPEARRKVFTQMLAAIDTLRRNYTTMRQTWNGVSPPLSEHRTVKELKMSATSELPCEAGAGVLEDIG